MKIRIAAAVVALGIPGCQPERDQADAPSAEMSGNADIQIEDRPDLPFTEARDSADIRIIENARPEDGSRLGWVIGPEPSVSIGEAEGEDPYMFRYARDATKLPDGRIPPKEANPAPLWTVFSPAGRVLGFVETPEGLEIREIGDDYVLGHAKGELDVGDDPGVAVGAVDGWQGGHPPPGRDHRGGDGSVLRLPGSR